LYYYIRSKENLLVEIQARVMGPLLSRARQIAELDTDPLVRLRLLSESLLTTIFRRLDHIWVYEHDYRSLTGECLQPVLDQRAEFERLVAGLIAEAAEHGDFRSLPPRLATLQFLNLHNHTYQWVKPDGRWDPAQLSREYCGTLLRGFGAPGAALPDMEARTEAFKRARPDLPLDPEAEWRSAPVLD
ncbi:TetR/AcrR family transcriptional regulator, partial [Streptomyces sp. NPDC088357]|uniref:TetR/AcrR family transcriptional regulator n=1 Tax=Streptomyces sp. NPDC088357 TaxID=3154655 RepID=UPI00342BAAF5